MRCFGLVFCSCAVRPQDVWELFEMEAQTLEEAYEEADNQISTDEHVLVITEKQVSALKDCLNKASTFWEVRP